MADSTNLPATGRRRRSRFHTSFAPWARMLDWPHAHITKVHAPHLSMVSNPGVVTRVILKAVHATG